MSPTLNEQTPPDAAPDQAVGRGDGASGQDRYDAARRRLRAAFDALDAAISRQAERAGEQADQFAEYSALQDDRSRLAIELDAAARRARALEAANGEASRRIERAAAAVRAIIADSSHQSRDPSADAGESEPDSSTSFGEA
ncbi:DUF4164 domain-containing protein [Rhodoblastus acidophilus]|uniref:DUF4164 domain-containing protein n=1 Tax=Candidatus Rhodoblastus alkanivorans TaxID=2954117 RepID=A0ABS9Z2W4_9HYPH|nr:DUF4164 family protein [Candidatus Rhodoblastus alkanivorans]MCI4677279.1 DUF4164 domain-containing protein [Candidatus Rhodoblastus alkanivorans]MCI4682014.1 DUF4164 domain-containing protein [Candidatus Rhodoblastus alkanivorans]MDI4643065.1 DUF4164 domain-containing protein [Rhodoblastus acidophilus]